MRGAAFCVFLQRLVGVREDQVFVFALGQGSDRLRSQMTSCFLSVQAYRDSPESLLDNDRRRDGSPILPPSGMRLPGDGLMLARHVP